MMNWKKKVPSEKELPLLLLLIVGVMEFLFITLESLFSYIGYYLVEDYIIVPCLLFVGITMTKKLTPLAKRQMLLAVVAIAWFVVVQFIHKLSGMGTHPVGTVFFIYLMAFPFAAVTEDRENRGLNLIGGVFLAASMVLVLYAGLLLLECVPDMMKPFVYWDGARLHVFWHSNVSACIFMIGIGFASTFFFRVQKFNWKLLLAAAVLLQFGTMALTNCRTTLLLTAAFFGGIAFFAISRGGWKRFVIGLAVALAIMVVFFSAAGKIYDLNNEILLRKITVQLQEEKTEEASVDTKPEEKTGKKSAVTKTEKNEKKTEQRENYVVNKKTGEVKIKSQNGQGTLSNDMKTLNGRTKIWKAAFSAMQDNKRILLWGTEYVGTAISAYHPVEIFHAHNSWVEMLMKEGFPGLLIALVYTWIVIRSGLLVLLKQNMAMEKKILAMLTLCLMATGFLEPYLFITNVYYHVTDFMFFFCTGYLEFWRQQLKNEKV